MYLTHIDNEEKFIVRSSFNRRLTSKDKMHDLIKTKQPYSETIEIQVPIKDRSVTFRKTSSSYKESATYRNAKVRLFSQKVTLKAPKKLNGQISEEIQINHVYMQEVDPPSENEKVEWHLLTNLETDTFKKSWEIVQAYKKRWSIETYFKVLKTTCKVEDCRLGTANRLKNFISLKTIIAWRLFWLTYLSKEHSDLPCTYAFRELEWKTLYRRINRVREVCSEVPTVQEAQVMLAKLGGYLNRANDAPPGIITIWRGWQRLQDMVEIQEITR